MMLQLGLAFETWANGLGIVQIVIAALVTILALLGYRSNRSRAMLFLGIGIAGVSIFPVVFQYTFTDRLGIRNAAVVTMVVETLGLSAILYSIVLAGLTAPVVAARLPCPMLPSHFYIASRRSRAHGWHHLRRLPRPVLRPGRLRSRLCVLRRAGGVHGHPDGTHEGAKALRAAVEAAAAGRPIEDAAADEPALATALEQWGTETPR
jgi:hypothetical protein